jgi:hypothetical protein
VDQKKKVEANFAFTAHYSLSISKLIGFAAGNFVVVIKGKNFDKLTNCLIINRER